MSLVQTWQGEEGRKVRTAAIYEFFMKGMPKEDIAYQLGISIGTVNRTLKDIGLKTKDKPKAKKYHRVGGYADCT